MKKAGMSPAFCFAPRTAQVMHRARQPSPRPIADRRSRVPPPLARRRFRRTANDERRTTNGEPRTNPRPAVTG
ncbi:hypothetical protein WS70_02360 [Burkholderia mayonis]|uniref:Uncharacterized protein n=1 Tax=Burkholderia mayonis TaxID=1385591 RepID=A0A1B4FAY3_9BURK|nr:hypothetical protein WS70_02360 [Burkholderia mayonis]KVE41411.1 hypothetical protein WS70_14115 [Burkholderia mayonis]